MAPVVVVLLLSALFGCARVVGGPGGVVARREPHWNDERSEHVVWIVG